MTWPQLSLKTCVNVTTTVINRSNQIIGYADNLNRVAGTILSTKEPFTEIGLVVNEQKTKLLLQIRQQRNRLGQHITFGNYNFEIVKGFTYLGANMSHDNDETQEIRKRINVAKKITQYYPS